MKKRSLFVLSVLFVFSGCSNPDQAKETIDGNDTESLLNDNNTTGLFYGHHINKTAYIPSMCYTKTVDKDGNTHNPCYACHNKNNPPNFTLDDQVLQLIYAFPSMALKNPYSNLFKDFTKDVAAIGDDEIVRYVNKSNYFDKNGSIILANKLANLPDNWDYIKNGKWDGYIPDCYYHFDHEGFDHNPKNKKLTGWVAFGYMPFLGTFWPTNGSTDDVLIRLPAPFRQASKKGDNNTSIYKLNLSILEALIKKSNVTIPPTDENTFGVDLDQDGQLSTAETIVYAQEGNLSKMHYVGYAGKLQEEGKVHIAGGLYPVGTEFLHSVRYINADDNGGISIAPRMKELRYGKKIAWLNYRELENLGKAAKRVVDDDPNAIEFFGGNLEGGLTNELGWQYQGFIENTDGDLRPQNEEETLNCMGCHSAVSTTTDTTYAFPRKLDNHNGGWYHWTQYSLKGVPEFQYKDGTYEFSNYLKLNKSGNEFRTNQEVLKKFYVDNDLNASAIEILHHDVSYLLYPSYKRALLLNKAYRALVKTQSYTKGRTAHIKPLSNVYKKVDQNDPTYCDVYLIE